MVKEVLAVLCTLPLSVRLLVARVTVGLVSVTSPNMLTDCACSTPEMVVCVPAATCRLYSPDKPSRNRLPDGPAQTATQAATVTAAPE